MGMATIGADQRLASDVHRSLSQLGYPQLNRVECRVDGKHVQLRGELRSYYLKQVAQSVAAKVSGVEQVHNRIRVVD